MTRPTALDHARLGTRTRRLTASAALLTALAPVGCGGSAAPSGDTAGHPSARPESPATVERRAAAPGSSGALALVPDGRAARTRLGWVDRERLTDADLPLTVTTVRRTVLGPQAGRAAVVVGEERAPFRAGAAPATSAIAPKAVSAVQSCLGDTVAQTILGPAAVGADSAVGDGLAASVDAPRGMQLRLCAAPHYRRGIHNAERVYRRRLGALAGTRVGHDEVGEREIMTATAKAGRVPARQLRAILAGGDALRALAPWRRSG